MFVRLTVNTHFLNYYNYIICARIYGPGFHQTPHTSLATSQLHEVKEAITYVGSLPCVHIRETGLTNQSVLPVCPLQSCNVRVNWLLNTTVTLDSPKKASVYLR